MRRRAKGSSSPRPRAAPHGLHTMPYPPTEPRGAMPDALISIVIPCRNEAANLPLLIDEIEATMAGRDFELIIVNDGSTDDTASVLAAQAALRPFPVRELRHRK